MLDQLDFIGDVLVMNSFHTDSYMCMEVSLSTVELQNLTVSGVGAKPKIPDGIPPRFPKKPTIRQEGDNLVMECLLEAHPLPEITWYRRDKVRF